MHYYQIQRERYITAVCGFRISAEQNVDKLLRFSNKTRETVGRNLAIYRWGCTSEIRAGGWK